MTLLAVDRQTPLAVAAELIVGNGLTVIVKDLTVLIQPLAFLTVKVPVYVPADVFAGTAMRIDPAGSVALFTAINAVVGVLLQAML